MQACFAEIVRIQKGKVEINCTILPNAIKSNRLVRKWGKNAEDVFQKCLDGITIISVQQSSAVVRVVNMSLRETDQNITYIADEKNSTVTLIGETKTVKTIVEFMNTTATETEDLRIEEKVELFDSVEVKMLQKMGYKKIAHIKVPDVEISLSNINSIITMKGMKSDIEKAKLQLFDMKNKFVCFVIEGMSSQEKELLMKQETINYVEERLRKENVGDVEWNIRNGQYLVVCCPASNDIAYCINIFKTSVVMSVISLRGHSNPLREFELWENKVQELYEMYGGKMTINVEEHAFVQLCSTNDISQPLVEDITSVIQSCKKQSDIKETEKSKLQYEKFQNQSKNMERLKLWQDQRGFTDTREEDNHTKP
ncbi:uncharacterized protein LOC132724132 isoform X2 [Ruditapes philippinarum]|uniref:uncharacterized protein LOC132724132 isoform X2 n=1 Tax=Ruditapes philippinarum TaxID=129788 RepID=UPI00295BF48B|nr:uncharacterized protein LOC132724132 isoform X2 [Ruditapes philippinarum]